MKMKLWLATLVKDLNPKKTRGVTLTHPLVFPQNAFFRQKEDETLFFVFFNIIKSYIFPESFIEIPQVVQRKIKYFHQFLKCLDSSLLQKN